MDPVQDILDNHTDMSDFLEIEAQVDDPEQRSRIITSGFWDLQELQTKTPAFAEKVSNVLRRQRGPREASAVSVFTEGVLKQADLLLLLHLDGDEAVGFPGYQSRQIGQDC